MKKTLTAAVTASVIALAISATGSCSLNSDATYTSHVTYVDKNYQGYPYYFVTDDSIRLVPSNGGSYSISDINGRKMDITWKTQEKDISKDPLIIEITGYSSLSQIESMLSNEPDTLGSDPASLYLINDVTPYLYKTGGYYDAPLNLNLAFNYRYGDASATHYLFVAYSSSPVDENGYFHLKFCHDTNGDSTNLSSVAIFSVLLPDTAYAAGVKGIILDFDGVENPESWKLTYATGQVENIAAD